MDAKDRIIEQRQEKRKKTRFVIECFIVLVILIIIALAVIFIKFGIVDGQLKETVRNTRSVLTGKSASADENGSAGDGNAGGAGTDDGSSGAAENGGENAGDDVQAVLEKATLQAEQYDYDGAIATAQSYADYNTSPELQNAVSSYQQAKDGCVSYPVDQIPHIFFHTLIKDPALAFDGDENSGGYDQFMCTIDEFNKIIQIMYDKGYVMVSLNDMCQINDDATVSRREIYLPEGKTPFVLSQDDVSYYHYMDGDGFAQKLIVDENGQIKNTYVEADGSISVGDYDMVPLIDRFVEQHPDFAYHGHKGVIALTGYEGVLGYRTDEVYKTRQADRVTQYQQKFFDEHPDFDFDAEVAGAKQVADAMKAEGWEFASHTWGHINPVQAGYDGVVRDTKRYKNWMEPVIGPTDILIFAFGADIGDWTPYSADNELFSYYKSQGFDIYCNVDGSKTYWVQFGDTFMRSGRRNIDGYAMYYRPDSLSDLFNVDDVWDSSRPPVPEM